MIIILQTNVLIKKIDFFSQRTVKKSKNAVTTTVLKKNKKHLLPPFYAHDNYLNQNNYTLQTYALHY